MSLLKERKKMSIYMTRTIHAPMLDENISSMRIAIFIFLLTEDFPTTITIWGHSMYSMNRIHRCVSFPETVPFMPVVQEADPLTLLSFSNASLNY